MDREMKAKSISVTHMRKAVLFYFNQYLAANCTSTFI